MNNYKQIISDALKNVVSEPGYIDMHEVALCHRLAVHLENSGKFTGYLIDCDYNRAEQEKKRNPERNIFRPDIIVHIRGSGENNNLIMVEAKKDSSCPEEKIKEKKRLKRNANKYQYKYAFFVVFSQDGIKDNSVIEIILHTDCS